MLTLALFLFPAVVFFSPWKGEHPWPLFVAAASAVPLAVIIGGAPLGAGLAIGFSFIYMISTLILEPARILWPIGSSAVLILAAFRLGKIRDRLDGGLAYWKLHQADLDAARNAFFASLAVTEQHIDSVQVLARNISQLSKASTEIERSLSIPEVANAVAIQAHETFALGQALVYRFGIQTSHLLSAFPSSERELFGDDYNPIVRSRRENLLISDLSENYLMRPVAPSTRNFKSLMIVPLMTGYDAWGVLRMESDRPNAFDRDDLRALAALAIPATLALQNADLFSSIEEKAIKDGLTGLYRRHYFDTRLEAECSRSRRSGAPLSLLFLDVDHFKSINDRYGHSTGDIVLKEVAATIAKFVVAPALAGRYGGEEFVVLLPEISKTLALEIAEEIRRAIEALSLACLNQKITISGGLATYPEDATMASDLTARADNALYDSKKNGRNRVTVA